MKILMTGITGFIGHHLGERLVNDGHEVHAKLFGAKFGGKKLFRAGGSANGIIFGAIKAS